MFIGQKVYVQKTDLQFHKWYKAHIIDIRRGKRPASQGTLKWCLWDMLTRCKTLPMAYVVRYPDDSTQVVTADRIQERL
jgi:hypothetical protein